jgi:hypothetical protein
MGSRYEYGSVSGTDEGDLAEEFREAEKVRWERVIVGRGRIEQERAGFATK